MLTMANPTLHTETSARHAENKKTALMKFHPWRLPLAAFTLAVLSALWLWRQIFAHEGVRERISSSAIPASFTLYYCLLAAGVFTGLKRDSSDLRFRRIVPMMTVVALSTTVPWSS